jgi:ABC-2 type transport system ATP-binding protein
MIDIAHLTHIYPATRHSPARRALADLSLTIAAGSFCILSGPNGSGKSTLFRILTGMTLPSSGSVRLGGIDLLRQPAEARRRMGVVFQSPAVDKHLSVMENLRLHAALYDIKRAEFDRRLEDALEWSDLKDRLADRVDHLSGGLARQVELTKALLTKPEFLLLDEPTTGLDPASRRNFVNQLHGLQRQRQMTVLMTSHVFSEAEEVDQVAIMKDGHLLANDRPAALRAALGREMVVVQSRTAERLEATIRRELGLTTRRHGDEIRLEETTNGASLPLLEQLLSRYRADIDSIAIKQPTLEDVFIHLTGKPVSALPALELVAQ